MKDVTITVERGGVISVGMDYDNVRYKYSLTGTISDEETVNGTFDAFEKQIQFKVAEAKREARIEYINNLYKNIRFYEVDEVKFPSVTSVIHTINPPDFGPKMTPDLLKVYAARGQVGDVILQKYIETGEWHWDDPTKIPECLKWINIMSANEMALEGNLPAFVEKHKVEFVEGHSRVVNKEHEYAGEPDALCKLNGFLTMSDLKLRASLSSEAKISIGKQLAAYWKAHPRYNEIEQGAAFIINGSTKQGFSQPLIYNKEQLETCWKLFLNDRAEFKTLMGV